MTEITVRIDSHKLVAIIASIIAGVVITFLTLFMTFIPFKIGLNGKWTYLTQTWNGTTSGFPFIYIYDITHIYGGSSVGWYFDPVGFIADFIVWSLIVYVMLYIYRRLKR